MCKKKMDRMSAKEMKRNEKRSIKLVASFGKCTTTWITHKMYETFLCFILIFFFFQFFLSYIR